MESPPADWPGAISTTMATLTLAIVGSPDDGYSPPRIPYFTGLFRNDLNLPPVPTARRRSHSPPLVVWIGGDLLVDDAGRVRRRA